MENYLRVLVIDDNTDNIITIRASLLEVFPDAIVYSTDNGVEGLKLAVLIIPNIILLDINMPIIDGFQTCELIKEKPELDDIPIIFLTALKSDYHNRMKALSVGADAFLTKPVDLLELTAQIKAMWRINLANIAKRNEQAKLNTLVDQRTAQLNETLSTLQAINNLLQDEIQMRIKSEHRLQAVKDKYYSILNDSPALICEFNINGELVYYNDVFHRYYPNILIVDDQNMIRSVVFRSLKNTWQLLFEDAITKNDTTQVEFIKYNNKECWIEWRYQAIRDINHKIISFYSIGIDITEKKKIENINIDTYNEQQLFFKDHQAIMLKFNSIDGRIIDCNNAAVNFYGYSKDEFNKMTILDLTAEVANKKYSKYSFVHDRIYPAVHRTRLGDIKAVDIFYSKNVKAEDDSNFAIIFQHETDVKSTTIESKLKFDKLTGLLNKNCFEEELNNINESDQAPFYIIMMDINGLQTINETLGYGVGDSILLGVSDLVKLNSDPKTLSARIGADEFIMVCFNTDEQQGKAKLKSLKSQFDIIQLKDHITSVTFGMANYDGSDGTLSNKLAEAETIMNNNKIYESQSKRSKSVNLIMNALFEKSQRELMHSKRVSELCEALAYQLNLDPTDIKKVKLAGLVHDIGKIGVDERILNKPSKLDMLEWAEIKKHPESGCRILSGSNEFSQISSLVLSHHERWDGKGYPQGIAGTDIPLESRIIAVADAFDAMTSVRTYNRGLSEQEALDELVICAGSQFDPFLVETFVGLVLKRGYQ